MAVEFIWPISVYYEDTDAGSVVYHANYLKFFERARSEWLRSMGIDQVSLMANDQCFAVKRADLDFIRAARFGDQLEVVTRLTKVAGASLHFEQAIYYQGTREPVLCSASVDVVCLKLKAFTPCRIPANIREVFQRVC